jgi:hypothetical protein
MYKLYWEYMGELRGGKFDTWEALEAFSKRLIKAGLSPWVPMDCPTPYDNNGTAHKDEGSQAEFDRYIAGDR